ncbi:MAG: hypothetical protein ACHQHP_02530 [Bacteroidia bacterium]
MKNTKAKIIVNRKPKSYFTLEESNACSMHLSGVNEEANISLNISFPEIKTP